ncbi:MAG: AAA family ATPase [Nitrospira sp.]
MHIQKIEIKNFRLLEDVELSLEERTTVIVGRNNSGKTSLAELFRRLLSEDLPKFNLEDFSLSVHEQFWVAFMLKQTGNNEAEIREALPVIEIKLTLSYDKNTISLGPLSDFIIDLDPDCTDALINIRYQLENGKIKAFFDDIEIDTTLSESEQKTNFFRILKQKERLRYYRPSLLAVDPNDVNNQKHLDWPKLRGLLQSGFINAQRGLDDTTHKDNDILGKILEALF